MINLLTTEDPQYHLFNNHDIFQFDTNCINLPNDLQSTQFLQYLFTKLLSEIINQYHLLQNNSTLLNTFNNSIIYKDLPYGSSDVVLFDLIDCIENFLLETWYNNVQIDSNVLKKNKLVKKYINFAREFLKCMNDINFLIELFGTYTQIYYNYNGRTIRYYINAYFNNNNFINIQVSMQSDYTSFTDNRIHQYLIHNGYHEFIYYQEFKAWYNYVLSIIKSFNNHINIENYVQNHPNISQLELFFSIPVGINTTVLKYVLRLYKLYEFRYTYNNIHVIVDGYNRIINLHLDYSLSSIKNNNSVYITNFTY